MQRIDGIPLQYVIGEWDFRYLTLLMKSPVFIPRPETEQLVGFVVDDVRSRLSGLFPPNSPSIFPPSTSPLHVLEIGCGSGAISLSLLHEIQTSFGKNDDGENGKTWEMTAIDVSVAAIDLTSKNAKKLKLDSDLRLRRASIHDIREGKCRG